MLLRTLLHQSALTHQIGEIPPDLQITSVAEDSRQAKPGTLFVARSGTTDGAKFVEDARSRGAVAVVCEAPIDGSHMPQVIVSDAAGAASILANQFHAHPSSRVKVLGITGTNGKTTTTYLIRHILAKVNQKCGMIGTVEIDDGNSSRESVMTTPGSCETAELLELDAEQRMLSVCDGNLSHALEQKRVVGVNFAGAAFLNLTGDHLDYHRTMENYAAAKARLFEGLDAGAIAAINLEDQWSGQMIRGCKGRIIRFGMGKSGDYRARDIAVTSKGTQFTLITPDGRAQVAMHLIGRHNIQNALAASALVGETFGLSVHQIASGLSDAQGAPGRLQAVRSGQPFAVLVDYAHTDDALENVLSALRPLARGKLRVLFGCGGDRDRTKRPRMARTAQRWADVIYVTSDNPRTENPQAILDEIVCGFSADSGKSIVVEIDRRLAIERAISEAEENDVVLIAGKGHENYQIIGTEKRHFDDVEEASRALSTTGYQPVR